MANIDNAYSVEKLSLGDVALVVAGSSDPSTVGYEAPVGSLFLRTTGQVYTKIGVLDTDWKLTGWIDELSELLDVQLTDLAPGQIIQYNGTKWVNITPTSGTDEKAKVSANDTTTGYLESKLVSGTGVSLTTLNDGSNETLQVANTVPDIAREPTGFPTRTTSQLSFNVATGEFTIQPLAPATSFEYYIHGVKYTVSTAKTATATNGVTTYFYFDATQTLQTTNLFTDVLLLDYAYAGATYWNSTPTPELVYLADERHGVVMDGATHLHFHKIVGTQWINGLSIDSIIADATGDSNTHAQCNVENGKIRDEDLCHDIYDTGGKVNVFDLEQELNPIAQIPVLYRTGTTGTWKVKTANDFPLIYSGTAGYTGANGLPAYNYFNGTTWTLAEVPNTHFFLIHILATNDINHPIVAIQGIQEYQNKPKGRDAGLAELSSLAGLPFEEFVPIGTIIFEARTAYANTPKTRIVTAEDGLDYVDWRRTAFNTLIFGSGVTDHGSLTGLADDDHLQYSLTNPGSTRVVTNVGATPTLSQLLRYDGTYWTNASVSLGEVNTASNVGTGTGVFAQKSVYDLQFKSLVQGGTTTISSTGTEITISSADQFTGTVTSVDVTQPTEGLTISGDPITTSGTLTFALANDLAAVEGLTTTGIATRTNTDVWTTRSIAGTTGRIGVTNGDGVSGNPTIDLATAGSAGTYATVTTDAYGRVTSGLTIEPIANGGTGLSALGTANQVLGVNAGATALEYKTLTAGSGISITHGANSVTITNTSTAGVTSVFSRTGAVVATEGDYSLNLLSDVTLTTPTSGQILRYNGTQWINETLPAGSGTVTSVAATAPAAGFTISGSPITTSGTLLFTLANDLAAVEGLTTTGIAVRTNTDAWTTRTITAGSTKISVTNGSGVAGNPTIDVGTVTLDDLSNVNAPTPGNNYLLTYNSTLGQWVPSPAPIPPPAGSGHPVQIIWAPIGVLTGTTTISFTNTAPLITEGTQLWQATIDLQASNSTVRVSVASAVAGSTNSTTICMALFRESTCIGMGVATPSNTGVGQTFMMQIYDTPGTTGNVVYTCRVGKIAGGTWYVNRTNTLTSPGGGALANNAYSIEEIGIIA